MTRTSKTTGRHESSLVSSIGADDLLSDVLLSFGLQTRVFCRSLLGAPWTLQMPAGNYAHFHVIERGPAFLLRDRQPPLSLSPGDLIVLTRGEGHRLSSDAEPSAKVMRVPHAVPGRCHLLQKRDGQPTTQTVCGAFELMRRDAHLINAVLPDLIHVRAGTSAAVGQLVQLLLAEVGDARLGSTLISSRLTDALFVHTIRFAIESDLGANGTWLRALRDPKIAAAVNRLHGDPGHAWTVANLASVAGMSRARFAARFTQLMSAPPLAYLTQLRIGRAAEALRSTDMSLKEIAARAGYESEAAFSKIFRRIVGTTPGAYRRSRRAPAADGIAKRAR